MYGSYTFFATFFRGFVLISNAFLKFIAHDSVRDYEIIYMTIIHVY